MRRAMLVDLDVLVDAELTERAFGEEPTCHIKHVFLGKLDIRDLLEQQEIQELEWKMLASEPDPTPQDIEDTL